MARRRRGQQIQQQPVFFPPTTIINPLVQLFATQQWLAERAAEQAFRQAATGALRQLQARGLEESGLTGGTMAYLAGQFAQQLGDIRARTAESMARAQLEVFQNLLNLAAQREQAALAAAGSKAAKTVLEQASGQLGNIMNAFAALFGLFNPATTTTTSAPTPPAQTPLILNPHIYRA